MDRLGKLLFPDNPKRVRDRKLQLLFFAVVLGVLSCAVVGLLMFLLNKPDY
jgi:hypothetical protein